NVSALCDELLQAMGRTVRIGQLSPTRVMPRPDDPVTLPYWAFKAVLNLALIEMASGTTGKGSYAALRKRQKADQIHWHRYKCVKDAIDQGRAGWTLTRDGQPDVF